MSRPTPEGQGREGVTDPAATYHPPAHGWASAELEGLAARGLRRTLEPLESPQGAEVVVGGKRLLNFSSNDYLGLAGAPQLRAAAISALERHGVGTGASRLVVGDTQAHHALEQRLAAWMQAESALLFNNGYAANVGVLQALAGPGDIVFSDELNHASIVDGCRLSRAHVLVYPHANVEALTMLMRQHRGRRRLLVTDAVFSMDGDRAPLLRISELCRKEGVALIVDEAHALGVLGDTGAGLCEALELSPWVDVRVGTLGKSLGAQGAFVAASRPVTELLLHRARSLVFSTALPAALCAAAHVAVDRVASDGELRAKLWRNIGLFSEGLRKLGVPAEPRSAVFSVVFGTPEAAVEASRLLREAGLLVKPIRPPTVPEGTSRLRLSMTAAHSEQQVERALSALGKVLDALSSQPSDRGTAGVPGMVASAQRAVRRHARSLTPFPAELTVSDLTPAKARPALDPLRAWQDDGPDKELG